MKCKNDHQDKCKTSNDMQKDFYDYKYWREVQRNQLTIVSNIYFGFSTAIIGFSLNNIVKEEKLRDNCYGNSILILGVCFCILSLYYYVLMTNNKLKDYRKTAELISDNQLPSEIKKQTKELGIKTWNLFKIQKCFLLIGFILCLIAYSILIF